MVKKNLKLVTNKKLSKTVKENLSSLTSKASKTEKLASKISGSGWIWTTDQGLMRLLVEKQPVGCWTDRLPPFWLVLYATGRQLSRFFIPECELFFHKKDSLCREQHFQAEVASHNLADCDFKPTKQALVQQSTI